MFFLMIKSQLSLLNELVFFGKKRELEVPFMPLPESALAVMSAE